MKIISNFKDYYDFVAGHDEDPRKIYNRKATIPSHKDEAHPIFETVRHHSWDLGQDRAVDFFIGCVWFCDQFYQYIKSGNKIYYNYYHIPEMTRRAINKRLSRNVPSWLTRSLEKIFRIESLSAWDRKKEDLLEKPMNTLYGQPIVYSRKRDHSVELVVNGNLKEIEFSQIKIPTMAFTELYNWLPYHEPIMPDDPTDITRFEGKGFDKTTSFRHPTK